MALQLRRGTNAQRLGLTPVEGEMIYVTDNVLVSISVTSINTTTETLSTTTPHGLSIDQQVKYTGATLNGLTKDQVYYVKTAPTITDFTLSTTLGGGPLNITGSYSVPLVFAKTPCNASGAPLGYDVSPLWAGDGITVGGNPSGAILLDELRDVVITNPNEGQTLYYDATASKWENTSILEVDSTSTRGGIVVGAGITQPMITFDRQADGVNAMYGIRGISADTDPWFVGAGSTGTDSGYLEIATGDNTGDPMGTGSPIYVRQYDGYSGGASVPWYGGTGSIVNELTLLDGDGNTIIPKNLTLKGANIDIGTDNVILQINRTVAAIDTQNTFKRALSLQSTTAGTPTVGYGPALGFLGQTTAGTGGTIKNAGYIAVTATDLTAVTEDFKLEFGLMAAGATWATKMELSSLGDLQIDGELRVDGNIIRSNTGVTTLTLSGADATVSGSLGIDGATINTTSAGTASIFNTTATAANILGAATGTISIGNATGTLAANGALTAATSLDVKSGALFVKASNGYVGISNSTPNFELDVAGSAFISSNLYVGDIGTVSENLNISASTGNDINITGTASAGTGGNITLTGSLSPNPVTIVRESANTSAATRVLTLRANSSGTPASGFGGQLIWEVETAATTFLQGGYIETLSTDVTNNAEKFKMNFGLMNRTGSGGTASPKMTLTGTGDLTPAGTLRLDSSSNPTSGAISLATAASYFITTGSGQTTTLAAGTEGQFKSLMMRTDGGGDMVVTVTNPGWSGAGTGTITFNDVGDSCLLHYINSKWFAVGANGVAFA